MNNLDLLPPLLLFSERLFGIDASECSFYNLRPDVAFSHLVSLKSPRNPFFLYGAILFFFPADLFALGLNAAWTVWRLITEGEINSDFGS